MVCVMWDVGGKKEWDVGCRGSKIVGCGYGMRDVEAKKSECRGSKIVGCGM